MSTLTTKTDLKTLTLKDFCVSKGFTQIAPVVRTNTNGYPYITFINSNNEAENVYFSKTTSQGVTEGTPVDKALLSSLQVGITTNAAGEERIKLVSMSRVDISSLLD